MANRTANPLVFEKTGKRIAFGCDELRQIVKLMDMNSESFNQQYTAEELVRIFQMCMISDWDFLPDQWEEKQVLEALNGYIPQWDNNEEPIYNGPRLMRLDFLGPGWY